MDATPKGPPVPPTPDILSPLFSRRISDLNARAPFFALHCPQRSRRISRHPTLDACRTKETAAYASSLSYTCLNFSRLFRRKLKQLPNLYLHVVDNNNQLLGTRKSNIRSNDKTILIAISRKYTGSSWCPLARTTVDSRTTALAAGNNVTAHVTVSQLSNGSRRSFFTLVFTPRRTCRKFDAFFTKSVAKRLRAEEVLLTGVASRAKHIYRLRPKAPNSELQPNRPHKQCRAALPRVLCKVSDY